MSSWKTSICAALCLSPQGDGSSVDVRINLGPAMIESESQNRLNTVRRMLDGAIRILNRLEVSLAYEGIPLSELGSVIG